MLQTVCCLIRHNSYNLYSFLLWTSSTTFIPQSIQVAICTTCVTLRNYILPTRYIFVFRKILTTTAVVSLNCYNRLVVFIETDCACGVIETKSLYFI